MNPEIIGKRVIKLMKKNKITTEDLSKKMGLEIKILNSKLNGELEFYLDEMMQIKNIFHLDTKSCDELFFQKDV